MVSVQGHRNSQSLSVHFPRNFHTSNCKTVVSICTNLHVTCFSWLPAEENVSLWTLHATVCQERVMEQEAKLFPSLPSSFHVVGDWHKASQVPFHFCFSQVIQSPLKPSRLPVSCGLCQRKLCVCQWPPLPFWTQLNRRRKPSQEELENSLIAVGFFSTCATARVEIYWSESAWNQFKCLDWFQGVAGEKYNQKKQNKTHWFEFSEIPFEASLKLPMAYSRKLGFMLPI